MRDYTRKAKIKDSNEWVIGYHVYVDYLDKHYILVSEKIHDGFSGMLAMKQYEVDGDTICNPTGLTDKNGNKIWENDVVKKHFYTDYDAYANSEEYVGIVKFTDCAWVIDTKKNERVCTRPIFESMAYSKDLDYFEVIGNIFDNEDLLKGE